MDPIWAATSIEILKIVEIQNITQPNGFILWLYNKAVARENYVKAKEQAKEKELLEKKALEKQKQIEHNLRVEKLASMKAILINHSNKPKTEIRMNNDGSICKFLC